MLHSHLEWVSMTSASNFLFLFFYVALASRLCIHDVSEQLPTFTQSSAYQFSHAHFPTLPQRHCLQQKTFSLCFWCRCSCWNKIYTAWRVTCLTFIEWREKYCFLCPLWASLTPISNFLQMLALIVEDCLLLSGFLHAVLYAFSLSLPSSPAETTGLQISVGAFEMVVVVAFFSLARFLGECSTIHSSPAPFFL